MTGRSKSGKGSRSFFGELKRRHVFRVVAVYVAVALGVLQVANLTFGPLHLPPSALTLVVVLTLLGLPVTAVIAWAFETTPDGVRATAGGGSRGHATGLLVGAVVLTVAAGFGVRAWLGGRALPFLGGADRVAPVNGTAASDGVSASGPAPESGSEIRLAVLPLENLSPDTAFAYLAGAMTEEINSALTEVPGFAVISARSAAAFAGSKVTIPRIADSLGVRYVVDGSVLRSGDSVEILAHLVDGRSDRTLWTKRYSRPDSRAMDIQVAIARDIAQSLRSSFTRTEQERIEAGLTHDPMAHDLYLRAVNLMSGGSEPDSATVARRIGLLRQAVGRDSTFAAAWFSLGFTYVLRGAFGGTDWRDSTRVAFENAIRHATLPAHRALYRAVKAVILGGDADAATADLRREVERGPASSEAMHYLAVLYTNRHQFVDAIEWERRARDLDPLNATRWVFLGSTYAQLGLDDEAQRALRRAVTLDHDDGGAWRALRALRNLEGRYGAGMVALDTLVIVSGDPNELEDRGEQYLWMGQAARGHELLERALRTRPWGDVVPYMPELVRARQVTGDTAGTGALIKRAETALRRTPVFGYAVLELAAVRGDGPKAAALVRSWLAKGGNQFRRLLLDPDFEPVRSDTAFQAALAEVRARMQSQARRVRRLLAAGGD